MTRAGVPGYNRVMPKLDIETSAPGAYRVTVHDGGPATEHRVRVPAHVREDLGVTEGDEERLVRESFEFLLEREPATSILREFDLDVIARYFPEYPEEIRSRLRG